MPATRTQSQYSVHPSIAMVQKSISELKGKTGRSLDEWMTYIKEAGPPTEQQRRDWLKQKHGMGTNYAWWLAERADGKGWEDDDPEEYLRVAPRYVDEMFAGPRAALRPIYDRLLELGLKLGKDVKACPCKTIVPLYRQHVIAQMKPATRKRIDFGLALAPLVGRGKKFPKRLIATGGFEKKDRITHRIPIKALSEIDDEVQHWLKVAYDLDK
ncbi:MAG TPA: DUF5655 domain-containing protein [Phycisphaerae bacterium]